MGRQCAALEIARINTAHPFRRWQYVAQGCNGHEQAVITVVWRGSLAVTQCGHIRACGSVGRWRRQGRPKQDEVDPLMRYGLPLYGGANGRGRHIEEDAGNDDRERG